MTDNDYWWEPPMAGTETEHVVGALERMRATFRWKADGLDALGLDSVGASALTLGDLLKHLALVEDHIFTVRLTGEPTSRASRRSRATMASGLRVHVRRGRQPGGALRASGTTR